MEKLVNRKKIVHLVESFGGGVFSILVDLVNSTSENFDIIICYGLRKETPIDFKKYFNNKVEFIQIENFEKEINFKKDLLAINEVRKVIKNIKPDIIHMHSSKAGAIGRIAIRNKKIKLLYNPHGFSFLRQDIFQLKKYFYWGIEKILATINKKCIIVGCSEGEYKQALKLSKNVVTPI